jgi:hypothetical protein
MFYFKWFDKGTVETNEYRIDKEWCGIRLKFITRLREPFLYNIGVHIQLPECVRDFKSDYD